MRVGDVSHGVTWRIEIMSLESSFAFDDRTPAVVMHRHDLPAPWINYLSNGTLHAFVSQAGGGFCWWKSATEYRLTRYRMYNLPIDSPGFYAYVREQDGTVWSPTHRPCEVPLEAWRAEHRPGVSVFSGSREGLEAVYSVFVAPDHDQLVMDLVLHNRSGVRREVDVTGYVEFSQLLWEPEPDWGYYLRHMAKAWFDESGQYLGYVFRAHGPAGPAEVPLVWMACSEEAKSWSCDRDSFMGNYRHENHPVGIERNDCGGASCDTGEPVGAIHAGVTLEAGERRRVSWVLGAVKGALTHHAEALRKVEEQARQLRQSGYVEGQRAKVEAWWHEHLSVLQVALPDVAAQRQINIWTPVNTVHTGRYSRSVNQWAPGIRGVGFRDTCQDMLSLAYRKPEWAKESFQYLLSQQFEDGHAVHTAFPVEKKKPSMSIHSDDHLWLPLLAYALAAETGDLSFLRAPAPYLAEGGTEKASAASAWEHLKAAVRFTETHLGTHRIPLILRSDWNDIIGKFAEKGRGESTFAGMQYMVALRLLIELGGALGDQEGVAWLEDCLSRQEAALLACAWDGQWWRRGFDDEAAPIGSESSPFGKIYLNPQSWAVLAGLGEQARCRDAMDMAAQRLDTGVGLKLLDPGFKTWPEVQDPFSAYGPGTGENGAIFCHANTWAIIAEALLGRGDRAWGYYTQLIPENVIRKVGLQRYQAEAYAWVSNIVGPENTRFGWANVTQVTGTATWMDVASTQYLLGLRPVLGGLLLDPCLPAAWEGIQVRRRFRGVWLDVTVSKSPGVERGVSELRVDGRALDVSAGALVEARLLEGRSAVRVEVFMR